jgi:hypothetical protein
MSTLMQVYCAIPVPAALIGLFVGIYLHTLPDEDEPYTPPPASPAPPVERRRLALPAPAPVSAKYSLPAADPGYLGGSPIYYRLVAAQVLRQAVQREVVTR